jgi:PhoPQ-activated pathogenicity-related protein
MSFEPPWKRSGALFGSAAQGNGCATRGADATRAVRGAVASWCIRYRLLSSLAAFYLLVGTGCGSLRISAEGGAARQERALAAESVPCGSLSEPDALDRYVHGADPSFRWDTIAEQRGEEGTILELLLVSQQWKGADWKHSLFVHMPDRPEFPGLALLVLRHGAPGPSEAAALRTISRATGTAAAFLFDIPNQPLFDGREEDPLLAYTFSQYLRTGEESWPLLFPMVKSVVRAMDATQAASGSGSRRPITRYVIAGHSKRGQTAWLSGATEPRVAGIISVASDVLNSSAQIAHHREVAGEISASSSIFDEVIQAADTPRGRCLMAMIDPYSYRERLAEPKLVVLGTNDDYTPADALNLYWADLVGSKSVLYLPNTAHVGTNYHPDVNPTAFAFVRAVASEAGMPQMESKLEIRDGRAVLHLRADAAAHSARLWTSTSATRDVRSSGWSPSAMRIIPESGAPESASFMGEIPLAITGFTAIFGELEFRGGGAPYLLSTQIYIVSGAGSAPPVR